MQKTLHQVYVHCTIDTIHPDEYHALHAARQINVIALFLKVVQLFWHHNSNRQTGGYSLVLVDKQGEGGWARGMNTQSCLTEDLELKCGNVLFSLRTLIVNHNHN